MNKLSIYDYLDQKYSISNYLDPLMYGILTAFIFYIGSTRYSFINPAIVVILIVMYATLQLRNKYDKLCNIKMGLIKKKIDLVNNSINNINNELNRDIDIQNQVEVQDSDSDSN